MFYYIKFNKNKKFKKKIMALLIGSIKDYKINLVDVSENSQ